MMPEAQQTQQVQSRPPEYDTLAFEIGGQTHNMHVQITHDGYGGQTIIRIGFPKGPASCMTFIVSDAEPQAPIGMMWVGFESKCATPDLPEEGGGVAMTRAAIKYVFELFPERDCIQLTDDSKIKRCKAGGRGIYPRRTPSTLMTNNLRDIAVPLAYHSLMLYGATWYQRKFGADVTTIRQRQVLQDVRRRLETRPPPGLFDAWMEEFILPATISPTLAWVRGDELTSEMRAAYDEASSWFDFYRKVNARCGCGVFAILIETVLRNPPSEGGMGLNLSTWTWDIHRQPALAVAGGRGGGGGCGCTKSARAFFRRLDQDGGGLNKIKNDRCLDFM